MVRTIALIQFFILVLLSTAQAATNPTSLSDLQQLIDAAEPGSLLQVPQGVYRGPVKVWKPLTLIGQDGAVIDGGGVGDVVVIVSHDVVFAGFRVVNSFPDVAFEPAGVKVANSRNVTIARNIIEHVVHAVYVVNSSGIKVVENHLTSFPQKSINDRGHGVYIWYSENIEVAGNYMIYVKDGVYSDHSYRVKILDNIVQKSRYGVHLMYTRDHRIEGNLLRENLVGMAPMYSCGIEIFSNEVRENRGLAVSEGIFVRESCDVRIEGNIIVGNAVGISIVNSPYPRETSLLVRGNVIAFNNVGLLFDIWASALFEKNDMIENAQQLSLQASSVSVLWRGNFWSDRGLQLGDRYYVVSSLEDLMGRWPDLWAFAYGPGYSVIKMTRTLIDVKPSVKAVEENPAPSPHILDHIHSQRTTAWLVTASTLTFIPLAAILKARKR